MLVDDPAGVGADGLPSSVTSTTAIMPLSSWLRMWQWKTYLPTKSASSEPSLATSMIPTCEYGLELTRRINAERLEVEVCSTTSPVFTGTSTSFGCFDGDKMYLDWDLATRPSSAAEAARDGLRLLYPTSMPVHRQRLP